MSRPRLRLEEVRGFPERFEENGKIKTAEFLDAANEVVHIISQFGTVFFPIVQDMKGNTSALYEVYNKDPQNFIYLQDMILTTSNNDARTWLLWLKRALDLIEKFFTAVINDEDIIQEKSNNLQPMIINAYNVVLKPYHGFLLQQTFAMLNRWIPNRNALLGSGKYLEENVKYLQIIMPKIKQHVDAIDMFLKENGFDDKTKV